MQRFILSEDNDYVKYLVQNINDGDKRRPHIFFDKFGFKATQKKDAEKAYQNAVEFLCNHHTRQIRLTAMRMKGVIQNMLESRACDEYWNETEISAIEGKHNINMSRNAAEGMNIASQSLNKAIKRTRTQDDANDSDNNCDNDEEGSSRVNLRKARDDDNDDDNVENDDLDDMATTGSPKDIAVPQCIVEQYWNGEDDDANDAALASQVAEIMLKSQSTLEDVWSKVIKKLRKENVQVQSIEARIIDLSGWTLVDWNAILHISDRCNLIKKTRPRLLRDNIPHDVLEVIRHPPNELQSINDLEQWKSNLSKMTNEDAQLAIKIISYYRKQLTQAVNLISTSARERDVIVNVIAVLFGKILQRFNIGQFRLYWIEKECTAVKERKRKFINTDYTKLTNDSRKFDLIVEMRTYNIELLLLEVGTDTGGATSTKYRMDHTQLKIALKDCLDVFMQQLHSPRAELNGIQTFGIQIIGSIWIIYTMTYDHESKFYFFNQLQSFRLPTSLSELDDFLPRFIENILALRHTMLSMVTKTKHVMKARATTPSPPSSPIHETPDTPAIKRVKKDPFKNIFKNIY
ncbi:hypothetical protein BC936DRAFT_139853 [Jimgerdemannia flammicorona]|uniref:Uncharacterized protein n=1 Tax=Jimgerdemannia flammicorona TaxID=994334 RepID=A0A433DHI7_9FUNG|nr:hypothetical protein BC936DRAFT_139853 [Jimgerdemannia flammicorona]